MKINSFIILFSSILSLQANAQSWDFSEPFKLSKSINSDAEESMPVFSKDSMILYFVRTYDKNNTAGENDQDIWMSKKVNNEFTDAVKLDALNNEYHNAAFGINKTGNTLYLLSSYEGKKDYVKGCATSSNAGGKWSKPQRMEIHGLDIEGNFYSFNINEKENVLIISYIGENSMGEEDLYYSTKEGNGTWTTPKNLGPKINTKGFEISPFLSVTGDTLFFSSNGHGGFGDADVFYSVRTGKSWDSWSQPINLGSKINSAKFDAYLTYSERQVFWSSNREGVNSDIYSSYPVTLYPLEAKASGTDVTIHKGSDGKIDLVVNGGKGPYQYLWSNGATVEDPQNLVKGSYDVKVTDALNQVVNLTVVINEPLPEVAKDLEEIIYFDLDSYAFNAENKATMDAFLAKLKELKVEKIVLESHCDQRASVPYNITLSKRRLNKVKSYLVQNGVNKALITGAYKGKSMPLVDCDQCTEEEYRLNRRTTIKVIVQK